MLLHLISTAPNHTAWQDMQTALTEDACLVLLADAVYAVKLPLLANLATTTIYALEDDLRLRGMEGNNPIQVISMAELVPLTLKAKHCISWF